MCGRLNITADPLARWMLEIFGFGHPGPDDPNVAPMATIAVVRAGPLGDFEIAPLRWWLLPHWSRTPSTRYSMFNARRETLATSPAFRDSYHHRRCVVPVSGFYEWVRTGSGPAAGDQPVSMPGKMPWYVHPHADPLIPSGLLLAGVWDRWHEPRGEGVLDTFAIVTTAVHPALAFIHDRQPVMLSPTEARHWVDPATPIDELDHLLGPQLPGTLALEPVSNRVNDARHKDPHCCDPVGPSRIIS